MDVGGTRRVKDGQDGTWTWIWVRDSISSFSWFTHSTSSSFCSEACSKRADCKGSALGSEIITVHSQLSLSSRTTLGPSTQHPDPRREQRLLTISPNSISNHREAISQHYKRGFQQGWGLASLDLETVLLTPCYVNQETCKSDGIF